MLFSSWEVLTIDQCTHEVRLQKWKSIITQCQNRPQEQSAKQWMKEHDICAQSYYYWQRRLRQKTFDLLGKADTLPATQETTTDVSFAEIHMPPPQCVTSHTEELSDGFQPSAIIKTATATIALSNDISETLLNKILKVVAHA